MVAKPGTTAGAETTDKAAIGRTAWLGAAIGTGVPPVALLADAQLFDLGSPAPTPAAGLSGLAFLALPRAGAKARGQAPRG